MSVSSSVAPDSLSHSMSTASGWTLIVPVKHTTVAKTRLTGFSADARRRLAIAFAMDVVTAGLASERAEEPSSAIRERVAAARKRLASPPSPRAGVKFNTNGYPFNYSNSYWEPVLGNQVGGASVHYAAVWARLHPSDFLARSLEGIADDWPIRYWDLEPYYDQIDEVVGVSGVPGNPAYPPKRAKLQPVRVPPPVVGTSKGPGAF